MIIVGELINASRKSISQAIEKKEQTYIAEVAKMQHLAGSHYIDVNAGVFVDEEIEYLKWLVRTVQDAVGVPCCLDSPNPKAIEAALEVHEGVAMINSISLERQRWDRMLPIVAGSDLKVVALCTSDEGMPETADHRIAIADRLINGLVQANVKLENIYVDPLVQPVATKAIYGVEFLRSVEGIMTNHPGVHTICGLSNISYGLPERKLVNQTFMTMAVASGLDGAIVNPMDKRMMANIFIAEALAGRDDYCMNLLKAFRAGAFDFS